MSASSTLAIAFAIALGAAVGAVDLHEAAQKGDVATLRTALAESIIGIDAADSDHYTPLHLAAGMGHLEAVELLLERGASHTQRDENGETALHLAAHVGYDSICGALLDAGADADAESKTGYTPLHMAAQFGHTTVAKRLLEQGADVAKQARNGATPLHWAAYHDKPVSSASLNFRPASQRCSLSR